MTRALVTGFVDRLGGLASSYSPAFHLTVIGQRPEDMAAAAGRVLERGGGMCLVENGEVLWELPLERGGLFTETPWAELTARLQELERLMRERGYRHGELLYSMFFFGFDSLPDFRLTTRACGTSGGGEWSRRRSGWSNRRGESGDGAAPDEGFGAVFAGWQDLDSSGRPAVTRRPRRSGAAAGRGPAGRSGAAARRW